MSAASGRRAALRLLVRWVVVAALLGGSFLLLAPTREYVAVHAVEDEILAYELKADVPLRAYVPAGIRQAAVTTWAMVEDDGSWNPTRAFQYSFGATLVPARGEVIQRTVDVVSRISGDPSLPLSKGQFATRLDTGPSWVTDGRTAIVDVTALSGGGGMLKLVPLAGRRGVLVRVVYLEPRSDLAQQVIERTLRPEVRSRLTEGNASLGFGDLPDGARARALASWSRRLVAEGREGLDYFTRRVLLGSHRQPASEVESEEAQLTVSSSRQLALNFKAPALLRLHGSPGAEVWAEQAGAPRLRLVLNAEGHVDVQLPGEALRTVVLGAPGAQTIQLSLPAEQTTAQLGDQVQFRRDGRARVLPDLRTQGFWRLDPVEPVRITVSPAMPHLAITTRAVISGASGASDLPIQVSARFLGTTKEELRLSALSSPSAFEWAAELELPVSDARVVMLRAPAGARFVELRGEPGTLVRLATPEPGLIESVPEPAYAALAPPGFRLSYAPLLTARQAHLEPENGAALALAGRRVLVSTQVRLEALEDGSSPIAPRVVTLPGRTRTVDLRGEDRTAGELWAELRPDREVPFAVRPEGLTCRYWVEPEALGTDVTLVLDGGALAARTLSFTSGSWTEPLSPGRHTVQVRGLSARSLLLCDGAAPGSAARLVTRRTLSRLGVAPVSFERRKGEVLSLLVFLVAEAGSAPQALGYQIDHGRELSEKVFSRRSTDRVGTVKSDQSDPVRLWRPEAVPDTEFSGVMRRYRIPLGDDLAVGSHWLRLFPPQRGAGTVKLWARVVVVGSDTSERESFARE